MAGLIVEGTVFFRKLGDPCWIEQGNVTELTPKENADQKFRTSKQKNSYGDALDTVNIRTPSTMTFTLDDWNPQNMGLVMLADAQDHTQTLLAVALEEMPIGLNLDCWYPNATGSININTVSVYTDSGGLTAYVLGDDYLVEPITGMIKPVVGGAISASSSIFVSYTAPDISTDWAVLLAGSNANIKIGMKVCARNLVDGKYGVLTIPQFAINPATGLNVFSEDFNSVQLSGNIIRLPLEPAGYFWELEK